MQQALSARSTPSAACTQGALHAARTQKTNTPAVSPNARARVARCQATGREEASTAACTRERKANSVSRRNALAGAASVASITVANGADAAEAFCGQFEALPVWAFAVPWDEMPIEYAGVKTWTRKVGKRNLDWFGRPYNKKVPTVVLHDLGMSSSSMESMEILCAAERQMLFFDQLQCGKTDRVNGGAVPSTDPSMSRLDSSVGQLQAVLQATGITKSPYHVFGVGYGGMLALEAASRGALPGLASLGLVSTPLSYARLIDDRAAGLNQLPEAVAEALRAGDGARGAGDAGAFDAALAKYNERFVCHSLDQRACFTSDLRMMSKPVFDAATGGYRFKAAGELADWDMSTRCGSIEVPTLLIRGEDDTLSAAHLNDMAALLPKAETFTAKGSGAYVHLDANEELLDRYNDFITKVEGK